MTTKAKLQRVDISGWDTTPPGWDESRWNGWRLDGYELSYPAYSGGGTYPIGVERFTSAWEMLDMIMQVSGKTWATDECIAGLVHRSTISCTRRLTCAATLGSPCPTTAAWCIGARPTKPWAADRDGVSVGGRGSESVAARGSSAGAAHAR